VNMRKRGPRSALKTWSKRAATRMDSLLWEEKLDRIKAYCTGSLPGRHIGFDHPGRFKSYCSVL